VGSIPAWPQFTSSGETLKLVAAQCRQACKHQIDLGLAGDESVEGGLVVRSLAHGDLFVFVIQLQAKSCLRAFEHGPCGSDLIEGTRGRRLDVDDNRVLVVDQLVEAIAELHALVRLCCPS
jgi:hypothetical protein